MNRATAETAKEQSDEDGITPVLNWLASLINGLVRKYFGYDDVEFAWGERKDENKLEQAQINQIYVQSRAAPANVYAGVLHGSRRKFSFDPSCTFVSFVVSPGVGLRRSFEPLIGFHFTRSPDLHHASEVQDPLSICYSAQLGQGDPFFAMTPENPLHSFDSATASPAGSPLAAPERRKGVLWTWSIAVTVVVLALLVWQCGSAIRAGRQLSGAAVQRFDEQLNGEQYGVILNEADEGFRHSGTTREETMRFLQAVHTKLGNAGESNLRNITVQATPGGSFVVSVYQTKFDRGEAIERFTWIKRSGELLLYGYNIQSNALIK